MRRVTVFSALVFLFYTFGPGMVKAQDEIRFTEGYAAPESVRYTLSAGYSDLVAWQMLTHRLSAPADRALLGRNHEGEPVRWARVQADEEGYFSAGDYRSGYLYFSFESDRERTMWLHASGHHMAWFNGVPRTGDIYGYDYLYLPVRVREGTNELLLRTTSSGGVGQQVHARLLEPKVDLGFVEGDLTLPIIVTGEREPLKAGVRIINSTDQYQGGWEVRSRMNGNEQRIEVPGVAPMTVRKVPARFDPSAISEAGWHDVDLELIRDGEVLDRYTIEVQAVDEGEQHSRTFISEIDGSLQYYSVSPQLGDPERPALFLSVHGAEVEAINQARAYEPKEWGTLVAPTNRRPRGFRWQNWGRIDALEVLGIGREQYSPDPQRIYLTGHSMGGQGSWYLGATYPDKWAAIGPAAGNPSMYTAQERIHSGGSPMEELLIRASREHDVLGMKRNYESLGVFVMHGDADEVVTVEHSRRMREVLSGFHPDFVYYEHPGGSHWYGNESVDWPPLFDFFQRREIPDRQDPDEIRFRTADPAISSTFRWATILQQKRSRIFSDLDLKRDPGEGVIRGTTENVSVLSIDPGRFDPGEILDLELDGDDPVEMTVEDPSEPLVLVRENGRWQSGEPPAAEAKGSHRSGPFKDAFNHRMVFVYGTAGSAEENGWARNKARYDAETWYYLGNGAVEMIPDTEFDSDEYAGRGVILYGNRDTNRAWPELLGESPVQVTREAIRVGDRTFRGSDLGIHFTYPRADSDRAMVAVVAATGMEGANATWANQYFRPGANYPDLLIHRSQILKQGLEGLVAGGFFDRNWEIDPDELIVVE